MLSSPSVPCPCGRHLSPARWTNLRESFVPKSLLGAHLLLRKGNEIMLFVAFLQKTMISIFPEGTSVLPSPKRQRSCGKTLRQLLLLLLDPSLLRSLRLRHWRRREEIHNFHPGGGDFRYVVHCPRGDTAAKMVWMDGGNRPPSRSMEGRGICYVTNKDNNIPFDRLNARAAGRASQRQMGAKIASNWFTPSNNSINRETSLQLKGLCYDFPVLRYVCYMHASIDNRVRAKSVVDNVFSTILFHRKTLV